MFGDDADRLRGAADYLDRFPKLAPRALAEQPEDDCDSEPPQLELPFS
jgi:hypothetical protein